MHCKVPGYNHCHTAYNLSPEPRFCDDIQGNRIKTLDNSLTDEHVSVSAVFVALNESDMDELLPEVTLAEARHHAKMLAAFVATEELELQRYQNKLAKMFLSNLAMQQQSQITSFFSQRQ